MNHTYDLIKIRDNLHREIVQSAVSTYQSDSIIEFDNPILFPSTDDDGLPLIVTITGIECNTGKVFDRFNRVVKYNYIPIEILCVLHHTINVTKQYSYKPDLFI